jgi:hypothetical protein
MYYFNAFKLTIQSELYFPELTAISESASSNNDILIKYGEVNPTGILNAKTTKLFYQANERQFWLHVPEIGYFLVEDGNQITIDPVSGIDEDSIRLFLLGSCMGALLMQRNLFLLHANAVKIGDNCISFAGQSGAGKSTLAAAFWKRGYSILADDICAVNTDGEVISSFPQMKVWADTAKQLNINTDPLRKIRPNIEKFAVALGDQFHHQALPLKVIYLLKNHTKDEFIVKSYTGMQKLQPLKNNTYREQYLEGLGKNKSNLTNLGRIASKTALVSITRPSAGFKLDELVELIEHDLLQRGLASAAE